MSEAIERALRQDRIVEERDPLVDGAVAGDDRRGAPVALEDDVVEVARLTGVETAEAEVIDGEDVGREQPPHRLLARVVGPGLVEGLEQVVGAEEEHLVADATGGVAQGRGEEGLPDADRPHEEHVLLALDEAERKELPDALAVEAHGGIPVEALEGLLGVEAGPGEAQLEILLVPARDLVVQRELEEVELREFRRPRISH